MYTTIELLLKVMLLVVSFYLPVARVFSYELSSAREAVKIGPERGKLKNLHCLRPLPGNSWRRHSRLEKVLTDAVVICKV
jgi:hypothetical protein